jgi:hypothetical protein
MTTRSTATADATACSSPDWSESLLSQMYLAHLFVMRRSLYEQVGGRVGFEVRRITTWRCAWWRRQTGGASAPHALSLARHAGSTASSGEAKMQL